LIFAGPALADILEHPHRDEVWGVSTAGGYLWIIDTRTSQLSGRISVGPSPYSLDFSAKGDRAYLNVPLTFSGAPVGVLVLVETTRERHWASRWNCRLPRS